MPIKMFQAIYQEYLNQGGEDTSKGYLNWANKMIAAYKKKYGESPANNPERYLEFVRGNSL